MQTNDKLITELMKDVDTGAAQLPDFQRSWVWDDNRIKALIGSVINSFPVGAGMMLEYGNDNIRFKYRPIEGSNAENKGVVPSLLILDGQQRLTSLYSALYNDKPVKTRTEKGKEIYRYYYIDIQKAIDPNADEEEIVVSVPENRLVTSDFGRKVDLDLSNAEKEYEHKMFPLNCILDFTKVMSWQNGYQAFYNFDQDASRLFNRFSEQIITKTLNYVMPVITLAKDTPKEAVCRVFENVNTGGVSLTVFELITAIFAMDDFELRRDWETRKENYFNGDVLQAVSATDFLTALTLLSSYESGGTVGCKKKDVLNLTLDAYKEYVDPLTEGFVEAEKILQEERIFAKKDLPYTTQLIPLAALCTYFQKDHLIKVANVKDKIKQWYWCGVFGELYGSANETRFANDIVQVVDWIENNGDLPKTCSEAFFNPLRLLSMQSRQSAAYKGIMALILKNKCRDFISGREMDFAVYKAEYIDIHHIFPRDYSEKMEYPKRKWNSIVNKTPITYSTNREIGGVAPSKYLQKIEEKKQVDSPKLDEYLVTHFISPNLLRGDGFDAFILDRAKMLLDAIETATGKKIVTRDSEEIIQEFGGSLAHQNRFI